MKIISSTKNLLLSALGLGLLAVSPAALAQTFAPPTALPAENVNIGGRGDVCIGLADMIRSGNIHLRNLPCFVKYFTQTLIALGGTLAVIMVMWGGYQMIVMGEEKKDAAKKTIRNALLGLAVALLAWIIVDLAVRFATE